MATHRTPIEPDDLLDIPIPDELSGYELVDGKLEPVTPASPLHGEVIVHVIFGLQSYINEHGVRGKLYTDAGFVLGLRRDPRRLRGPDVAFVSEKKLIEHGDPGERFARFVPDLAVEVDLTSGRKPGGMQRVRDYIESGVPLVWVIHPRTRSATIYRGDGSTTQRNEHESLEGEDILAGLQITLKSLF